MSVEALLYMVLGFSVGLCVAAVVGATVLLRASKEANTSHSAYYEFSFTSAGELVVLPKETEPSVWWGEFEVLRDDNVSNIDDEIQELEKIYANSSTDEDTD